MGLLLQKCQKMTTGAIAKGIAAATELQDMFALTGSFEMVAVEEADTPVAACDAVEYS